MKTCKKCGGAFSNLMQVDGKIRNMSNRKFCITCSPFGKRNTLDLSVDRPTACSICGGKSNGHKVCQSCHVKARRYARKLRGVHMLGGKCSRCGWAGDIAGFDFHHTEGETKEFDICSNINLSWSKVEAELKKCQLLCATCHTITHTNRDEKFLDYAAQLVHRQNTILT